jgi:hypothetical protein
MAKYFNFWPTVGDLAGDFNVSYVTASSWHQRGEIPSKHDFQLLGVGRKRGFTVTHEDLFQWHRDCAERRKRIRDGLIPEDAPFVPVPFAVFEGATVNEL